MGIPVQQTPEIMFTSADLEQGAAIRRQVALIEKARQAYLNDKFIPKRFNQSAETREAYLHFIGIK